MLHRYSSFNVGLYIKGSCKVNSIFELGIARQAYFLLKQNKSRRQIIYQPTIIDGLIVWVSQEPKVPVSWIKLHTVKAIKLLRKTELIVLYLLSMKGMCFYNNIMMKYQLLYRTITMHEPNSLKVTYINLLTTLLFELRKCYYDFDLQSCYAVLKKCITKLS